MLLIFSNVLIAQESTEPNLDKFKNEFQKKYFKIGTVMQFVFDYQNERTLAGKNGFSVATMRLNLHGDFDAGFGYFFQTNFASSPAILDAFMYYQYSPLFKFQIGQFKTPFSTEFLVPAQDIDFVNRSRVVSALAPNRQIGFEIKGSMVEKILSYNFGIFNGNPAKTNNNDNNKFLYAGRITLSPNIFDASTDNSAVLGLNAAVSDDSSSNFYGSKTLMGIDFRLNYDKFLLSGEFINAEIDSTTGNNTNPTGYYATFGYKLLDNLQFLLRWDKFDEDNIYSKSNSDQVIFGINFWPTGITELQFNYIVDTDDSLIKHNQILINSQIVF